MASVNPTQERFPFENMDEKYVNNREKYKFDTATQKTKFYQHPFALRLARKKTKNNNIHLL